ncbi:MAG: hypothetical protein ACYDG6_01860 [Thermincolia bacterium]
MQQPEQQSRGDNIPMPPMGDSHPYTLPQFYTAGDTNPFGTFPPGGGPCYSPPFNGGTMRHSPQTYPPMTNPFNNQFPMGYFDGGYYNPQNLNPYYPSMFTPQSLPGMMPSGPSPFMTYGATPSFMPFTNGGIPNQPPIMMLLQFMQTMMQQMSSMVEHMSQIMHGEQKKHDKLPIPPLDLDQEQYPHLPAAATPQWLNTLISG